MFARSPPPAVAQLLLVRSMRAARVLLTITVAFAPLVALPDRLHDETAYTGKLDDSAWKRHIEHQMQRQIAGEKPPWHGTWKDYWTGWYDGIRISPGLPWPGSEFKTHEDMVRYIKHRLKAHGLPTYEQT